jgi:Uri superfamily endonuclease
MSSRRGTYALVMRAEAQKVVQVGCLGSLEFAPGYYVYVGSAFGPGGVHARVRHHRKIADRPRWHIDYLRLHARVEKVWFSYDSARREHQWAAVMAQAMRGSIPLSGFGASDCGCASHLFYFPSRPGADSLGCSIRRILATASFISGAHMIRQLSQSPSTHRPADLTCPSVRRSHCQ